MYETTGHAEVDLFLGFDSMGPTGPGCDSSTVGILPETIMEVENHRFVEENNLPRGHVPLPYFVGGRVTV